MNQTKIAIIGAGVCMAFCGLSIADPAIKESQSFLERTEKARLVNEPAWILDRVKEHQVAPASSTYKWNLDTNYVVVSIYVSSSVAEATNYFNKTKNHVSIETKPIAKLGDEAFVSTSGERAGCMIVYRQTNVVVQVTASSFVVGEKWAGLVAEQIAGTVSEK